MPIPSAKARITALVCAAILLIGLGLWPSLRMELLKRKMRRWSQIIRETIQRDSEWSQVRGRAGMKSGRLYGEIGGNVGSEESLQKLKLAIQETGFPFPVRWSATVVTNMVAKP